MSGVRIALATKHGKEAQIAPAFQELLGWEVLVADIDTDHFGSFDGQTPRLLSPRETVLAKARAGAKAVGLKFGLASEGTIGLHPAYPFSTSDHELIGFVDLERETELVISHVSPNIVAEELAGAHVLSAEDLIQKFDLPNHAVILKLDYKSGVEVIKGLRDPDEITKLIVAARVREDSVTISIESDFRAMCSPSRQDNIAVAARKAAERLACTCPSCGYLGYGVTGHEYGLKCGTCGFENLQLVSGEIHTCLVCDFVEVKPNGKEWAEASSCQSCNP